MYKLLIQNNRQKEKNDQQLADLRRTLSKIEKEIVDLHIQDLQTNDFIDELANIPEEDKDLSFEISENIRKRIK